MLTTDKCGTPLGSYLDAASPAEVRLVERTLAHTPHAGDIERLIADRGYDSNPLRVALVHRGIEPIIPARRNNRRATHQDGRRLRRYAHRWVVERTFAWLGWFRRLLVRHERLIETYRGFFHFACALLVIRVLLK
jgi:transposase